MPLINVSMRNHQLRWEQLAIFHRVFYRFVMRLEQSVERINRVARA